MNENYSLLSGIYYINYKRVLKIVLPIFAIIVTLANVLAAYLGQTLHLNSFSFWGKIAGQTIGSIFLVYGIITFVFFILERNKGLKYNSKIGDKLPLDFNSTYIKIIIALSVFAGVIQIGGIIICLFLYYKGNEWLAGIGLAIVAIMALFLYIVIIIIWIKYSRKNKTKISI